MVKNIDRMIESVIEREDLMRELAEQESYDDVYDFCTSIEDGYTQEELFEFLEGAYEDYGYMPSELEDATLNSVAGGAGNLKGKMMAGVLSSLVLFPVSAVGTSALGHGSSGESVQNPIDIVDKKQGANIGIKALSAMRSYKYMKGNPHDVFKPVDVTKKINRRLRGVEGQKKAKEQIESYLDKIEKEFQNCLNKNEEYNHADVLCFNGSKEKEWRESLRALRNYYKARFHLAPGNQAICINIIPGAWEGDSIKVIEELLTKAQDFVRNGNKHLIVIEDLNSTINKDIYNIFAEAKKSGVVEFNGNKYDLSKGMFVLVSSVEDTQKKLSDFLPEESYNVLKEGIVNFEEYTPSEYKEIIRDKLLFEEALIESYLDRKLFLSKNKDEEIWDKYSMALNMLDDYKENIDQISQELYDYMHSHSYAENCSKIPSLLFNWEYMELLGKNSPYKLMFTSDQKKTVNEFKTEADEEIEKNNLIISNI
ncbi:MAG: hypothetical protein ACI4PR_02360 [Acutalibacteraceae bacterium]